MPRGRRALDSAAVHAARDDVVILLADARRRAQWRGERVSLTLDGASGTVRLVTAAGDTALTRPLSAAHGVTLAADRAAVTYAPTGLGFGASNARILLTRGAAADTILVSRLGRVRW